MNDAKLKRWDKKGKPYPYIHQKRTLDSKDEELRRSVAQKLAETPKSERLNPANVPDSVYDIPCVMTEFNVRAAFLKHLAKTKFNELRAAGISLKQIKGMRHGYTPNGFNTHHMVPIHGGGTNDFSNLILIRRVPYHDDLHNKVINPQIRGIKEGESEFLFLTNAFLLCKKTLSAKQRKNENKKRQNNKKIKQNPQRL